MGLGWVAQRVCVRFVWGLNDRVEFGFWPGETGKKVNTEDTESTEGIAAGTGWHGSGMRMGWGRRSGGIVVSLLDHRLRTPTAYWQ